MEDKPTTLGDLFKSILTSLVPKNLFAAMAETQILPLIVFALVFGGVLTTIGEKGALVIRVFEGINEAMMAIVHLLMWVAPVGIGALLAGRLGEAGGFMGFWPQLASLGTYVGDRASCPGHSWLHDAPFSLTIFGQTFGSGLCQSHEYPAHDRILDKFQFSHLTTDHGKSD